MTEIAFGPFEPDIASVGTPKSSYVNNVVPRADGWGPMQAVSEFTSAMTGYCRGTTGAVQLDNSTAIFGGNDSALFKVDPTARTWSDVSKVGGYAVSTKELWDFAQFGNGVVAVTNNNNPQIYTMGSSSLFDDLAGSPPQARRVSTVGDFLVLSGLTNNPNRIQWSAINDPTTWTPGSSQADYNDFPDGGYVQGVAGGEIGLVFQDRAIRRMIYVGPPLIFQFQRISEDRGVLMRYSTCKSGGLTFFLSNDGFYMIDRGGSMTPIGAKRVDRTILATADLTDPRYMQAVADPVTKRVHWFHKSAASANVNVLDKELIYDWSLDRWSQADANISCATSVIPLPTTLESLDAIANLDALPYSLDAYTSTYASSLAIMTSGNRMGFRTGDNVEATLDTPEGMIGNGVRTKINEVQPIGDAAGGLFSVRRRDRLVDTYIEGVETPIGQRGYATFRSNARFNTIRAKIPAGELWTYMRAVELDPKPAGRR